jgi:hypothetical protein
MRRRTRANTKASRKPRRREPTWAQWSDERLLGLRFKDLGLRWRGTWIEERLDALFRELEARQIRFRPHVWLSSEWMSPLGVPGIAIPFYLAHPRLMRLERRQMLEVEGGSRGECLKILRHECGHAIQQAYRLHRRSRWQELFGASTKPYPDSYRPDPTSRRFVQHLRMYYAQSHPDEDFAETFAVWLGQRHRWRQRYAEWPAIDKLQYVDELMHEIRRRPAPVQSRQHVLPLHDLTTTLQHHYAEKRRKQPSQAPDLYDRHLTRLFSRDPAHRDAPRASRFLARNRSQIRRLVSRWTDEYQFTLDLVLSDMIQRCRELGLRAVGAERQLRMDFAVVLTVNTMHFLYNRRSWVAL